MLLARLAEDAPERVVAELTASFPGLLVLTDLDYPGWIAEEDGPPAADPEGRRLLPRGGPAGRDASRRVSLPADVVLRRRRRSPCSRCSSRSGSGTRASRCRRGGARDAAVCGPRHARASSAAGLLGLVVGSFLNVVVHRLPRDESIVFPGSRCPSCGAPIAAYDNVPVLSWILLAGRCRVLPRADRRALPDARARQRDPLGLRLSASPRAGATSLTGAVPLLGRPRAARDRLRLPDPARRDHAAGNRRRARARRSSRCAARRCRPRSAPRSGRAGSACWRFSTRRSRARRAWASAT